MPPDENDFKEPTYADESGLQSPIFLPPGDAAAAETFIRLHPSRIGGEQKDKFSKRLTLIPVNIILEKDSKNRLMKDSLVKIKQVSSFDKRRFIKYIGNVPFAGKHNILVREIARWA